MSAGSTLRLAVRHRRHRPGECALAVAALAGAMALACAAFAVLDGSLLRGLPFDRAERSVRIERLDEQGGRRVGGTLPLASMASLGGGLATAEQTGGSFGSPFVPGGDGRAPERARPGRRAAGSARGGRHRALAALVAGDIARLFAVGLLLALPIASWLVRPIAGHLWRVTPWDPPALAGAVAAVLVAVALATLPAVRRVAATDPAQALREEY